jgi:hypothetical protein
MLLSSFEPEGKSNKFVLFHFMVELKHRIRVDSLIGMVLVGS